MFKKFFLFFFFLLVIYCLKAEAQPVNDPESYGFIAVDQDYIMNGEKSLDKFYRKLNDVAMMKTGKVHILQIGDSHIKPGYMAKILRERMREQFGDAGRGLVATRVNLLSNGNFNRSGTFKVSSDDGFKSPFNKLTFLMETGKADFKYRVFDSLNQVLSDIVYSLSKEDPFTAVADLPALYGEVTIAPVNTGYMNYSQVDGISLENGTPGVIVSSYGINGASYYFFNSLSFYSQLIKSLKPDLLIVSLGANDAYDRNYNQAFITEQVTKLVNTAKEIFPDISIILSSPADHFIRGYGGWVSNPTIVVFKDFMIDFAIKNNCAYWDLFTVMGGPGSMRKWYAKGLAAGDLVHFSQDGYLLQGELLFRALFEGFRSHNFVEGFEK